MRLLPPNSDVGISPYLWLIYLSFFIIHFFTISLKPEIIILNIVGLGVFLILYFRGFWLEKTKLIPIIVGIMMIGVILLPYNPGASVFFIYASAFLGNVGKPSTGYKGLALILVVVIVECWFIDAKIYTWAPAIFITLVVGGPNIHFAERNRLNKKLLKAQRDVKEMATVAERERIGRDLHDLLGHTLSVITIKSQLAGKLMNIDSEKAKKEIQEVETISRKALQEVREVVKGYRQGNLNTEIESIKTALDAAGIKYSVEISQIKLPSKIENVLSFVLRESITNIVRHSKATACKILLKQDENRISIKITDNGIGYQPNSNGTGLAGIQNRIKQLEGTFSIEGLNGTNINLQIPVNETKNIGEV